MRGAVLGIALLLGIAAGVPARAATIQLPPAMDAAIAAAKEGVVTDAPDRAQRIATGTASASALADPSQRALAVATMRWLAGEAKLRENALDQAEALFVEGLKLVESIQAPVKLRGDLLMSRGWLRLQREQAVQALADFQAAYRVFGGLGERRSQALALQNIALLYIYANDGERAQSYYRQAAEAYDGDPMLLLSLHSNRGSALITLDRNAEAIAEFEKALAIARAQGQPTIETRVLMNLARGQLNLRQYDAADRTLARAFDLVGGGNADMLHRQLLATAARLAQGRGDIPRAERLIRRAFDGVDLATTTAEFRHAHLYARDIFAAAGNSGLAFRHLQALVRLDDKAAKVATTTGAALMAARFNYAEQEAHIQKLKAEEAERSAHFQRTLTLSIGAAALVILGLLSFGVVTLRRSRDRVRASNVILNQTNAALEKALKAKTEFLATTSHEIRTPLNGILGMTQVMLADRGLAPEMRDRIGIVHGAGVTMRSLVDDILDVAKMEAGNLTVDPAPMDLRATLREVTRMWEEQARAKGLGFALDLDDAPHWIVSDAGRLRQIVFNLLSNAIKFTHRGTVSVCALAEGEGDARRLALVIRDTGIGIPADKLEEIFESFRQADSSTTRQFGGTGLGLTICRNLARALGGDIRVESVEGEGSSFRVDLPLVAAEAPASAATAEGAGGGAMLILDRNPIARSMLRTLFAPRVASLHFAGTPAEALEVLRDGAITLLLIDEVTLKAGGEDWPATLAELAAAAPDARSALLWLNPDDAVRAQVAEAGIGALIEKPIAGAALVGVFATESEEKSDDACKEALVSRAA